jgi:hypothetical protein
MEVLTETCSTGFSLRSILGGVVLYKTEKGVFYNVVHKITKLY